MHKLVRITTVAVSLNKLLEGQLAFMSNHYEVIAVSSNKEELMKVGEREGVDTYNVEMTRTISPINDLKSLYNLYKLLKKEKPYIVHTHTPKAGTIGMIAAYLSGIPNRLHTVAGLPLLEARGKRRKILNLVEKITYACATKVYPNSHGLKEIIRDQKFCKIDKLKVIGNGSSNGIKTSYFDPHLFTHHEKQTLRDKLGVKDDDFVFIYVGRIVRDKGIQELIEAFQKLNKDICNIKLLLVGDFEKELDPLSEKIEREIEKNPNIITVGFQKDVRCYFAISDTLTFPSYREGFPNVVMQAGSMSIPSIVSDINGCNEIIEEGKNGFIIPVKNVEMLYERMKYIYSNSDKLHMMKLKARDMIVSRYEQKVIWGLLLDEYKALNI